RSEHEAGSAGSAASAVHRSAVQRFSGSADAGVAADVGVSETALLDGDVDGPAAARPAGPVGHEAVAAGGDGDAEGAVRAGLAGGGDGAVLAQEAQGRLDRLVGPRVVGPLE